jgi:toxin ParE1/3/4
MKVRYTIRARQDITDIYSTIYRNNRRAAARVRARIRSLAMDLGHEPRRGQEVEGRPGVRRIPVVRYPYAVYFTVEQDMVVILHIRQGARDDPKVHEI